MTASAKKIPPPIQIPISLSPQYSRIHLHPPWSKMADGDVTMRSDLESGEENLLTKSVCFFRTGDFMANGPFITVDLVVISSLESTHKRYSRAHSDVGLMKPSQDLLSGWCDAWAGVKAPAWSPSRNSSEVQPACHYVANVCDSKRWGEWREQSAYSQV